MEVSGQRHTPAALPPGNGPDAHLQETMCPSEPVWQVQQT